MLTLFALFFSFSLEARAGLKPADVRKLIADKKFAAAETAVENGMAAAKNPQEFEPWMFLRMANAYESGDHAKALATADSMLKGSPVLEEEVRAMRARALEKLNRPDEVLAEDRRLLEMAPNVALKFEATMRSGRTRLKMGQAREARNLFASLERKSRGTPDYAEVIYELMRAERKTGSATACRWARKLYQNFPIAAVVKDWGADLSSNEVDGEKLRCPATKEDFRTRVRVLVWSGEDDKARNEVQQIVQGEAERDRAAADEIRAWYLLQTGEPDRAFELLQAGYPARKDNAEFLTLYASSAARSGNFSAAVGAYDRMAERAPSAEKARKAAYQAGFLSYQFRDYDGAFRRFQAFRKKYPKSGLSRDARWNLAWISYLKGDDAGAIKRFKEIAAERQPPALRERTRYWLAMSLMRAGQLQQAQPMMASIAADRSGSYYGALARQRLSVMAPNAPMLAANPRGPASIDSATLATSEATESEESLAAETQPEEPEEAVAEAVQENGRSDVLLELPTPKAPANARRFEKAKALISLGFPERARWELYEIERRTSGRAELKTLLTLYEEAGQFHRSSAIAQLNFGGVRVAQGYDGARALWESAYPRAYMDEVKSGARENSLPPEFIWGIMRAESHFKRDAISPVGAMGLMQIMPNTGRKLATLKKDPAFEPTSLLQPPVAVKYGSYYLSRLASHFDGSIPLTAAAYNAGPHRVHAWLMSFGSLSLDEFIEHIPFLETREYVRRVVANALVYDSLYGGGGKLVNLTAPVGVKGRADWSRKESWD